MIACVYVQPLAMTLIALNSVEELAGEMSVLRNILPWLRQNGPFFFLALLICLILVSALSEKLKGQTDIVTWLQWLVDGRDRW